VHDIVVIDDGSRDRGVQEIGERETARPGLRWLLRLLYVLTGLLTATAAYLGGVTAAEFVTGSTYQGYVYQWTVLVHLGIGVLVTLPFVIFAPAHARPPHASQPRRAHGLRAAGLAPSHCRAVARRRHRARAPGARALVYWVHVLAPIGVAWAFLNHRRRGRALRPGAAWTWATATAASVALTAAIDVRTSRRRSPRQRRELRRRRWPARRAAAPSRHRR
jgi:hypothetical protein